MPTPVHHTRYIDLWPRVKAANGRRVRLRVLKNGHVATNTISRLRTRRLVPRWVVLEAEGGILYGRTAG